MREIGPSIRGLPGAAAPGLTPRSPISSPHSNLMRMRSEDCPDRSALSRACYNARKAGVKHVLMAWTIAILGASACETSSGARRAYPIPEWYNQPPTSGRFLYFLGSANGATDETMARELAVQKALGALTLYCGANITSEFSSKDIEHNGVSQQEVSATIDIAGDDVTIRQAVVKEVAIGAGSDGTYDAYALIEWPKSEYDLVLAGQRQRAERALGLFLEAESAAHNMRILEAENALSEAQSVLGPMKARISLSHPKYQNDVLLREAMEALEERLKAQKQARRQLIAVGMRCLRKERPMPCRARIGALRQKISEQGFKISTEPASPTLVESMLTFGKPPADTDLQAAGLIVAVEYRARTAKEGPFIYAWCRARGALFDTDTKRIVHTEEVKPNKDGHPRSAKKAIERSCRKVEAHLANWLEAILPAAKESLNP